MYIYIYIITSVYKYINRKTSNKARKCKEIKRTEKERRNMKGKNDKKEKERTRDERNIKIRLHLKHRMIGCFTLQKHGGVEHGMSFTL